LIILLTIAPAAHEKLKPQLLSMLESITNRLSCSEPPALRFIASKALAVVTKYTQPESMNLVLLKLVSLLQDPKSVENRQGAAIALHSMFFFFFTLTFVFERSSNLH